jgi:hypothetical protein
MYVGGTSSDLGRSRHLPRCGRAKRGRVEVALADLEEHDQEAAEMRSALAVLRLA